MQDCIFCQIVSKKLPTEKVWESDDMVAFKDIAPRAPKHVLLVPRKHIESVSKAREADRQMLGNLMLAASKVADELGIKDAFRLEIFNGKKAGQTVSHLHVHLLGGWKNVQKH